jgi:hypothetical protein
MGSPTQLLRQDVLTATRGWHQASQTKASNAHSDSLANFGCAGTVAGQPFQLITFRATQVGRPSGALRTDASGRCRLRKTTPSSIGLLSTVTGVEQSSHVGVREVGQKCSGTVVG